MKTPLLLSLPLAAALSACTMMGPPTTLTFKHNPVTADPQAMGTAVVTTGMDGMLTTTLNLMGLTPGKTYAAHYHAFGPDSATDPCASNGPVTVGFPSFTADAAGRATVSVTSDPAKTAGNLGAYINVHYGDDLQVIPLCAPIRSSRT